MYFEESKGYAKLADLAPSHVDAIKVAVLKLARSERAQFDIGGTSGTGHAAEDVFFYMTGEVLFDD